MLPTTENINTEFKPTFNEDVIESLVAFANAKGGNVYVGVTDAGKVKGVTVGKETIQNWINEVKNKTAPQLIPDAELLEIETKTVVKFFVPEYPLDAIRELVVNALVHRDYQSPTDIQIRIYDNSITFFNPSGLFGNITESDLSTDHYQASTRNKLLAEALYLTSDIEKYGSGFIRIRKAIADYLTMKFECKNLGHGFLTQFSYEKQRTVLNIENITEKDTEKDTEKTSLSKNQVKILSAISENELITAEELVDLIGINLRNIKENISKLKQKGHLQRIGPDKGGYWLVIER
jgi:ATP-dependent DNA helicase RecG